MDNSFYLCAKCGDNSGLDRPIYYQLKDGDMIVEKNEGEVAGKKITWTTIYCPGKHPLYATYE